MKVEKKTAEYTVLKRTDGRFAVKAKNNTFINGEEKVKILQAEGLLATPAPKAEEAPAEETSATEAAAE
jgi:hypothetical protein